MADAPKEFALKYATFGWAVLALYGVDEFGRCRCGRLDCTSPGKHPHPITPGVYQATKNVDDITAWPDDVNVGIALGQASDGLMVLDIDIEAEARKLLAADFGLSERTPVSVTGRGSHIFFISEGETRSFNLSTSTGAHLGEVRGDGLYVVAPPSTHFSGTIYRWLNRAWEFDVTDDPLTYVHRLLAAVSVDVVVNRHDQVEVSDEEVEPTALPEVLMEAGSTDLMLRQVARGSIPITVPDRSEFLWQMARSVVEAAEAADYPLDDRTLAGVLRKIHDDHNLHKYRGSREFWRLARKALAASSPQAQAAEPLQPNFVVTGLATPQRAIRDGDYTFDEADNRLYYWRQIGRTAPRPFEVANYLPEIETELEVDDAEAITRTWKMRFSQADGTHYEMVMNEDERTVNKMEQRLNNLPSSFITRPRMQQHIVTAAQLLSPNIEKRRVFSVTGWVDHKGAMHYLLPSAPGAIGPAGIDQELRIEKENLPKDAPIVHGELDRYGLGVRPPTSDEEREQAMQAFLALIYAAQPTLTMPIVLQVLAGPLVPAGAGESPPLVHVLGGTGTYKTSFSVSALSLFGTWNRDEPAPLTWGRSTGFGLSQFLWTTKDLTLLVDDYKVGTIRSRQDVVGLIQAYSDRTGVVRGTSTGKLQKTYKPRGLILSNGEDKWENVASAEARTIEVRVRQKEIADDRIQLVQDHVRAGHLQMFGGLWLQWLAQHPEMFDQRVVSKRRDAMLRELAETMPHAHRRLLSSIAVLQAIGSVLVEFVGEMYPPHVRAVEEVIRDAVVGLAETAVERDLAVKEAEPFRTLASAINEALVSQEACLRPRGHTAESANTEPIPAGLLRMVTPIGWHWTEDGERWVLLTRDRTFLWYQDVARRTGQPLNLSWSGVVNQAVDQFGGKKVERVRVKVDASRFSQISGLAVPLHSIMETAEEERSHTHSQVLT